MSALIILVVALVWARIGFVLWRWLIRPRIKSPRALYATTLALAGIWLVGPVLDEILGAREFAQACREIPEVKFHGPVAIGTGSFFDEHGKPRWKNDDEFSAIKRNTKDWYQIFDERQEWTQLRRWPMPIFQSRSIYFVKSTGQSSVDSYYRTSPGGWIKRVTGWGMQAPYQCPRRGVFPVDEARIVY
jgi:hypothetical protein